MSVIKVQREIAGRILSLETGKVARQAQGAVWAQYGDTVVLATVLTCPPQREIDYFPLFVDYRENQYAAGKIPGGFFKREGRPSTKEILTMRLIDRPIRPLFPDDFVNEVQIQCLVLSTDNENDPDTLAVIGASAALAISPLPFQGPLGIARVGYVDGQHVVNPTHTQLKDSLMDLVVAGPAEGVNMLELDGKEAPEAVVAEGIAKGTAVCGEIISLINEMVSQVTVSRDYKPAPFPEDLKQHILSSYGQKIRKAKQHVGKAERAQAVSAVCDEVMAEVCPESAEAPAYTPAQVKAAFYKAEGKIQREMILAGQRPDGRAMDQIRPLAIEVGVLPRTHGSAIFSRGETQALVTTTLGTPRDEQIVDGLQDEFKKKLMLHYNFPPFSVGEIRPIRGPGRREIGHGALAEKSLEAVMPDPDVFPYTVRVVADMLGSNGSTSQATVCGATLAMLDAGVPLKAPVAGISVGMVSDDRNEKYVLLTDIAGEEDFHGDMDFKVAGTSAGITGIQLDMKARYIPQDRIVETIAAAHKARLFLLAEMAKVLSEARSEISAYAPMMVSIKIDPEKIGKVIGPGGKMIRAIQEETDTTIDIEDDGTVFIASRGPGAKIAREKIEALTAEAQIGQIYTGKVVSVRDFGAFIEIFPGQDGFCHISELDKEFVKNASDAVKVGDMLEVKVTDIDDQGKVRVSRKAVLTGEEGTKAPPRKSGGPRRGGPGGGRRGR